MLIRIVWGLLQQLRHRGAAEHVGFLIGHDVGRSAAALEQI